MAQLKIATHIDHLTPKLPERKQVLKSRTYAFVVDLYAIVFFNKFLTLTWITFVNKFIGNIALTHKSEASNLFSGISNLAMPVVFAGYFFFFYYLNNGRTIGKLLFKLKVCAKNNRERELTAMESFSRAIGYLFCNYLFFLPFALVYLRKDGKSIHDFISSTYVLREDEMAILDSLEENSKIEAHKQEELFPEDPVSSRISKIL